MAGGDYAEQAQIEGLLQDLFPLRGGATMLELVALFPYGDDGDLRATLRLVLFERPLDEPEPQSIWSVKEQEVYLIPGGVRDNPARLFAFLRGWAAAVAEVLAALPSVQAEALMPHELLGTGALLLHSVQDEAGFRAALLRRGRLGRLLPRPA